MKKVIFILSLVFMVSHIQAQEKKESIKDQEKMKEVFLHLKDTNNIAVYIDGKKSSIDILQLIDPEKIVSMNVLKGKMAQEKYNVQNVLLVTSINSTAKKTSFIVTQDNATGKITYGNGKEPVVIVDGEVKDSEYMSNLDPDSIISVKVIKDKEMMKKYNSESGVIIVETKKGKSKKGKSKK